ncbi:ribonuclease H-like domain-containing protein [Tanacetum coccineum]
MVLYEVRRAYKERETMVASSSNPITYSVFNFGNPESGEDEVYQPNDNMANCMSYLGGGFHLEDDNFFDGYEAQVYDLHGQLDAFCDQFDIRLKSRVMDLANGYGYFFWNWSSCSQVNSGPLLEFFDEVKRVVDLYLIQWNYLSFIGQTLLQVRYAEGKPRIIESIPIVFPSAGSVVYLVSKAVRMMSLGRLNSASTMLLSARFYLLAIIVSFTLTPCPLEVSSVQESHHIHDSNSLKDLTIHNYRDYKECDLVFQLRDYKSCKAHLDPVDKDLQVVSEPPKGLYTSLNKDQNLLFHLQVVMSANDDFSLHDDEELSLHDDASLNGSGPLHYTKQELSLHDDASLNGSAPASNKGDAPAKPPQIITTNTLSNIKLPVLQKDDYDTWAMEMEHYLEYIDNEVWKVIQNGNSKKRVTKGKDGVYRVLPPTTQEEQVADEKERKARTLLLMAIPKDHLRRFHGMDDAKEIWAAIKTRKLGEKGMIVSKTKLRITVRCPLGLGVSDEECKSIKYIQKTSSSSQTSDNVAFLSQTKASSSKHKPSHNSGSYSTYTTSSSKATPTATPDQIDDLDLEEMDINWQIAMTAIKIKKFYKKTGRRPRVDGKMHVAFDKRKVECFNCHNTGHFARECKFKSTKDGSRQEASRGQDFKPVRTEKEAMMKLLMKDSFNALKAKYDELQSEFGDQEAALTAHKLGLKKLESLKAQAAYAA